MGETLEEYTTTTQHHQPQPSPGTPEAFEPSNKKKDMINSSNSRVEIDTSPPFGSVKEAVTHFEGRRALWIPLHLLHHHHHPRNAYKVFDTSKAEEQALELEKDLSIKEQETLSVLKELETAKRIVEDLKLRLQKQAFQCMSATTTITPPGFTSSDDFLVPSIAHMDYASPDENVSNKPEGISVETSSPSTTASTTSTTPSPSFILMELKQAKLNLSRTTNDLAVIRSSVESLNEKMSKEKVSGVSTNNTNSHERLIIPSNSVVLSSSPPLRLGLDPRKLDHLVDVQMRGSSANLTNISRELQQLNFAAEQFIKMAEASKCEVLRAMSEIDDTKASMCMKTAEMRWIAAKKMEEAARAVEAVALAEMKCLSNNRNSSSSAAAMPHIHNNPTDEKVSFEDYYSSLIRNIPRKAEDELSREEVVDAILHMDEENTTSNLLKEVGKATQEVELSKRALEAALNRVEVANIAKVHAKETLQQWRSEHGVWPIMQNNNNNNSSSRPNNSFLSSDPHRQDSRLLFDLNRSSNLINHESKPVLRPSISLKDILGRKKVLPQDLVMRNQTECSVVDKPKVPLSEMLRLQRGVLSGSNNIETGEKHGINQRQFIAQRKKFGFIHISLPLTKQGRKKMQASNSRSCDS